jgi:cytochrome c oxidase cbb3-type subunit 3
MADKEVDSITGTETTGHVWDGIRELNTPLPKWWLWTFYATIIWALVFYILYPAWPWLGGYTRGVLGYSSRAEFAETMAAVDEGRVGWINKFTQLELEEIAQDPELLQVAMAGGRSIFAENCAGCHGSGGAGAPGYPILVDDDWIWGGTLEDIHTTVTYGIRNENDESRYSEMPAFGADEILEPEQISAVADYVLSLSGAGPANEQGKMIFEEQCVACHGEDGKGIPDVGGPNLTDGIWLYGGNKDAIVAQITKPRQGVMPPWNERLDDAEIKQVTIYVHSLGGGQ